MAQALEQQQQAHRRRRMITQTLIALRIGKLDKRQLEMAAKEKGQSLSAFVRDAAMKEAYRVLAQRDASGKNSEKLEKTVFLCK